jgi:carbonic anhydrase
MKKVFHFDSPHEGYQADAAVVWCFDHRFELSFRKFLTRTGVEHFDAIKIAGGAKALASPGSETERQFVLDQIRASIRLHETRRVILMVHSDCGGYGGLAAFDNDPVAEAGHHRDELYRAAEVLRQAIPGIQVDAFFIDFTSVWQAELEPATEAERGASLGIRGIAGP